MRKRFSSGVAAPYLTIRDIALQTQVCEMTVRRWLVAQRMPYVKVGRGIRVAAADFEQFLSAGRVG